MQIRNVTKLEPVTYVYIDQFSIRKDKLFTLLDEWWNSYSFYIEDQDLCYFLAEIGVIQFLWVGRCIFSSGFEQFAAEIGYKRPTGE
jgi:hypothetical protein